jgi:hypothetical protein
VRRPSSYAPLSVTFSSGRTGTAIQRKYKAEGLGVWAAIIAAGKRGRGQIVFAHDADWQAIGIFEPPSFALRDFLKTTGQLKQTRTTRHGHVMYVQLTRYGDWNKDAYRQGERERKARYSEETNRNKAGRMAEGRRRLSASELELELELEEELDIEPRAVTELHYADDPGPAVDLSADEGPETNSPEFPLEQITPELRSIA